MDEQTINIRDVQHFLYCKHRWGLLKIGSTWAENYYVTKANLLHKRAHDSDNAYTSRGKRVYTSIAVYNDLPQYNLYGVLDCLEIILDKEGTAIPGMEGKYRVNIVEYKPTQPKGAPYNDDDLMQVFAQKLCVDFVFSCNCDAYIYYADTKKRFNIPVKEIFDVYNKKLLAILKEMRDLFDLGVIPMREKGQKCSGCSMKNICMPSIRHNKKSLKNVILESIDA